MGYAYKSPQTQSKPTYTDVVVYSADPPCPFGLLSAGTTVQSIDGPRAIETLNVGDRVLSQNTSTGSLVPAGCGNSPQLADRHPEATGRWSIPRRESAASGRPEKGGPSRTDLKPGDIVRTLGGAGEA